MPPPCLSERCSAEPGVYATVDIGVFFAASTHTSMTAIFLLFEMTGNYMIPYNHEVLKKGVSEKAEMIRITCGNPES